jgi:hypothetical protein
VAILLLAEVWVHPVMALTEWVKLAPKGQWLAEPAQPAMNVVVSGSYAYCAMGTGGLAILDIANPANPQLVATLPTRGVIVGVAVSANYAYLVDGNLWVIDISDRAQPRSIAECSTYGSGNGVAVQGHYVYVTAGIHGLFVFDVSDPSSPQQSALYDTDGFPHALAVSGNIAFVLDGGFGLLLLDVTNPAKPSRVGTLNCGWTQAVAVSGDYAYIVTDYFTGYPNFLVTSQIQPNPGSWG